MVTIIFSNRTQLLLNKTDIGFLNDFVKAVRESKKELGYIIEDGKVVGIEKEM